MGLCLVLSELYCLPVLEQSKGGPVWCNLTVTVVWKKVELNVGSFPVGFSFGSWWNISEHSLEAGGRSPPPHCARKPTVLVRMYRTRHRYSTRLCLSSLLISPLSRESSVCLCPTFIARGWWTFLFLFQPHTGVFLGKEHAFYYYYLESSLYNTECVE